MKPQHTCEHVQDMAEDGLVARRTLSNLIRWTCPKDATARYCDDHGGSERAEMEKLHAMETIRAAARGKRGDA